MTTDAQEIIATLTRRIEELERGARFTGLLEQGPDAVYVIDVSGNFVDANDTALEMMGFSRSDIPHLNFFEMIRKDQKEKTLAILKDHDMRTNFSRALEYQVKCNDESLIWIQTRASLVKERNGELLLRGIAVDVTDRKKREEELKEREENLSMALEGAELGVWHWDTTQRVVTMEKGWGKQFSQESGESITQEIFLSRLHPNEMKMLSEAFKAHLCGETNAIHVRHRLKSLQGTWHWMSTRGKAVEFSSNGRVLKVAGTFLDITSQVRMEKALARHKAAVEEKMNRLEESQAALKAILGQREKDREEMGENMTATLSHLVLPALEKVGEATLSSGQRHHLEAAMTSLSEIVSPFTRRLTSPFFNLTPMELKVAEFIRQGHTSKEMALTLNLSKGTIDFHRNNIRKKLGLNKSGTNLRTQLLSLTHHS